MNDKTKYAARAPGSWNTSECNLQSVRYRLVCALSALDDAARAAGICDLNDREAMRACTTLPESAAPLLREAFEVLDEVTRYLPSIEVWCVVKHYSDPDWEPAVWCGFLSMEQADAFGAAIDAHYAVEAKRRGGRVDRFLVERRQC